MSNQQATVNEQPSSQITRSNKQVAFGMLLPLLIPQLPKDRAMQLQTLFNMLKRDEIPKDQFVQLMKGIVGDQMLRLALSKMQQRIRTHQGLPGQQYPVRMPTGSSGSTKFNDPHALAQLHQRSMNAVADQSHNTSLAVQVKSEPTYPTVDIKKELDVQAVQTSNSWQPSTEQNSGLFSSVSHVKKEPNDFPTEENHRHHLSRLHGLPSVNSTQIEHVSGTNQGTIKDGFSRGPLASTSMPHATSASSLPPTSASPSVSHVEPTISAVKTNNPNCESQYAKLQQMSNQQATVNEPPSSQITRYKKVPFGMLFPLLIPQLPKDRARQLQTLFNMLKRDEIPKDQFVHLMKGIVGDQMLRLALSKVQQQVGKEEAAPQDQAPPPPQDQHPPPPQDQHAPVDINEAVVGVLQSAKQSLTERNMLGTDVEQHVSHALQLLAERPDRDRGRARPGARGTGMGRGRG